MWSVFFILLSYLDRNVVQPDSVTRALDGDKHTRNGTVCAIISRVGENFLYRVSGGGEEVRSLVSPAGKLLDCSVTVEQTRAEPLVRTCRMEQRAERHLLETPFARVDEAKLMCEEFRKSTKGDAARHDAAVKRSKRGFTYPGTLWCGAGNMADGYEQLGDFAETDSCCRTHDHCPHVIHAFSSKYGHTNFKWHSISHCHCDNTLKACLRKVNDTSSRVVGQAFFNVIGVPCFELVYEDQCAERHWYGLCKRYEKRPVAVVEEAVPYDFGGIDVIDKLTVAPPKIKISKQNQQEKPETMTQSSRPEEPSLGNVVTAPEELLKVLTTVSTSRSLATDPAKGDVQASEKKKQKNTEKKKNGKKRKGNGRKRKQKAKAGDKTEEGVGASSSRNKAEEAVGNFINESDKQDYSSRTRSGISYSEYELRGKEEPRNEVMEDEPTMDKETVSITTPTRVQKKLTGEDPLTNTIATSASMMKSPGTKAEVKRAKKEGRKKSKKLYSPVLNISKKEESTVNFSATIISINPRAQTERQSRPVDVTPVGIPKAKRKGSKERADRGGRKKRRKVGAPSPTVAAAGEQFYADHLEVTPRIWAPNTPSVQSTEGRGSQNTSPNPLSKDVRTKRQRSKGPSDRRRQTASRSTIFQFSARNRLLDLQSPQASGAKVTAANRPTWQPESHGERRHLTAITSDMTNTLMAGEVKKQRRKAAIGERRPIPEGNQTEQKQTTFTAAAPSEAADAEERDVKPTPCTTTSATLLRSRAELSIERAKAQFVRKKGRKAALSVKQ
ncbi:uncharacterized protein proca1 [Thalassophryne amazonica]|uniref:uncharacterized protein proca1 n=1 Tax=Thalassophryne amazonica TaxID=390379 RepID=UPI00147144C2|nr:uncharacterized protein proca1 [Thalassophryne amazonica]